MAVPNLWRTKKQRYSLQAEICPTCTQAIFPPRAICPHCHQPMEQATVTASYTLPVLMPLPAPAVPVTAGDD
jgi:uncharacterized OB-fold protein